MKHLKPLSRSVPKPAGEDFWCQVVVVMQAVGLPVPKELVQKCLGIHG